MLSLAFLLLWQSPSLLQQGLIALQHGQLQEARQDLEKASRDEPGNPYVWSSLAEVYLRSNEPRLAASAAEAAEKLAPDDPIVDQALAMYYSQSGDSAHALVFAKKIAAKNPRVAFEWVQIFLRRQDFSSADALLEPALAANPKDPQLVLALGVTRYGQRRFEDAILAFLKVIGVDATIPQPYQFLGKMLDQAGSHLDEITQDFQKWSTEQPQNAQAQLLLAKALLASDSRDEHAEPLLRKSIALNANDWEAHFELGVLLANKHQYEEAQKELQRSTELDPKQPQPHYHLARVYDRTGQPERAKAEREIHRALIAPRASGMQKALRAR